MNKIAIIFLLTFAIVSSSYAQKTPALRSESSTLKSASVQQSAYPKFSINKNQCELQNLSINQGKENGYQVTINFTKSCDKRESATLDFAGIEEAMLFKNLLLNEYDYDMIHLNIDRNDKTSFWVDYAFRKTRGAQLK